MPDLTSLKVPRQVRDRLAQVAESRGMSVRALLDELSRTALDAAEMDRVAQQMNELREAEPETWAEYAREGSGWEESTAEPLDT